MCRNNSSLTVEDVLCVIGPDPVIRVMTDGGCSQGRVAGHDVEAALWQHVKRPLQVLELEVEPAGVAVRRSVRVPVVVQGVSEHLLRQADPAADEDPRQLFGLCVGVTLSAPRSAHGFQRHRDVAIPPVQGERGVEPLVAALRRVIQITVVQLVRDLVRLLGAQKFDQIRQLEVFRLSFQPSPLREVVRQDNLLISQVIQHIPEQKAISVDEIASSEVPGQVIRRPLLVGEQLPK